MLTSVTNRYSFQAHHFRLAHDITLDNNIGSVDDADTSFIFECNKENDFSRRLQSEIPCPTDHSRSDSCRTRLQHLQSRTASGSNSFLEVRNLRNAAKSKLQDDDKSIGEREWAAGNGWERGGESGGTGRGRGMDDVLHEPAKKHKPDSLTFAASRTPRIEDLAFGGEPTTKCGLNGVGGRQMKKDVGGGVLRRFTGEQQLQQHQQPQQQQQQHLSAKSFVTTSSALPDISETQTSSQVANNSIQISPCTTVSTTTSGIGSVQQTVQQLKRQPDHIHNDRFVMSLPSLHQKPTKSIGGGGGCTLSLAEELQAAIMSESGTSDMSAVDPLLFPRGVQLDRDIVRCSTGGISQFLVSVAELGSPDQVDPINKFRDVVCDMAYGCIVDALVAAAAAAGTDESTHGHCRRTDPDGSDETRRRSTTYGSSCSSTSASSSPSSVYSDVDLMAATCGPAAANRRQRDFDNRTSEGGLPITSSSSSRDRCRYDVTTSLSPAARTSRSRCDSLVADATCILGAGGDDADDKDRGSNSKKYLIGQFDKSSSLESSRSSSPARRSPLPNGSGSSLEFDLDELDATHRGCHRFVPRHPGELAIEISDPIYVDVEEDDLWCEGINLRTKQRGIFPTAYATDLSILDDVPRSRKFFLKFLGSIEVSYHRGNEVLCQAINKVVVSRKPTMQSSPPPLVSLEINEVGVKMTERNKKKSILSEETSLAKKLARLLAKDREPAAADIDHLFSLKNICFCGYHPKNERYLGIISKHPLAMRFACHVFQGEKSTRTVAEVIGDSFQRFYQEYLAAMHPTEDFYLE